MNEDINKLKTYALYRNDKLLIKESKNNEEFFTKIFQERNEKKSCDFSFYNYSELKVNKQNSQFSINGIQNFDPNFIHILKSNISHFLNNGNIENSNSIDEKQLDFKFSNVQYNLRYLKTILTKNDENKINFDKSEFFNKLNKNFHNLEENIKNSKISDFHQGITQISQQTKLIIDIFNNLLIFHSKIINFILKLIKLINDFFQTQQSPKNQFFSLNSVLVNRDQDSIIIFNRENEENNEKEEIKNFFFSIIEKYKKVTIFTEENDQDDIQKYFNEEVLSFANEITTEINENYQSLSTLNEKLTKFSMKFKRINNELTVSNFIFDQSKSDFFWFLLQNYQYSSSITNTIDSILSYYNNYIEIPFRKQIYEDFVSIYNKQNGSNSETNNSTIYAIMEQTIKDIQQTGKFFYFKVLFQIVIKNLINQKYFPSKISKFFPINNESNHIYDNEKYNYEYQYKSIGNAFFTGNDFNSLFWYDKEYNFYLEISYFLNGKKELQEREINIFNKEYSRFIVHTVQKIDDNKIIIPYFSNQTLYSVIRQKIKLNYVDKILIFLEIATALKDLHANNEYHGSICNQAILMNSKKDVYLSGFSIENLTSMDSTPKNNFYFNPPEKIHLDKVFQEDQEKNEDFIKLQQSGDIFSFGVLMFSIITEAEPEIKFNKLPRSDRYNKMKYNFFDFLFSDEESNKFFDENNYLIDDKGNCFIGIKEIISKCMKNDINERYSSFEEIIKSIKELLIYNRNKEEIEFRYQNAASSFDYRCTFSDIVESYFTGQEKALNDINAILFQYTKISYNLTSNDDIAKKIFEIYQIRKDNDFVYIFADIFDLIIHIYFNEFIDKNRIVDISNKLYSLSIDMVMNQMDSFNNKIDFIIPVSTLGIFIENKIKIGNYFSVKWIYYLAKELSFIHSKNLYHGCLSKDKIGVYFNNETKIFFPSIILFYSYEKRIKNKGKFDSIKFVKYQKNFFELPEDKMIDNFQLKDIKCFLKIVNLFDDISEELFEKIKCSNSMNNIVYILSNYILSIDNQILKNISFIDSCLSSCQITFSSLQNIFNFIIENKFSFKILLLDFESILNTINEFLENTLKNPSKSINENIVIKPVQNDRKSEKDDIIQIFEKIKSNCTLIYSFILDELTVKVEKIPEKSKKKKQEVNDYKNYHNFETVFFQRNAKKKWLDNPVERKITFSELCLKSAKFLMKRYILSLNPYRKYKLIITINNRIFSKYQDFKLKADDIKNIANEFGHDDVIIVENNVIIYIHPKNT